jgi:hypothetical protein
MLGHGPVVVSEIERRQGHLVQCGESVAEHGTAMEASPHLVQRPQSFGVIGIPFKELT